MSICDLKRHIGEISVTNSDLLMPLLDMTDWKLLSASFKALEGIKRDIGYKIHIRAQTENKKRIVYVDLYNSPAYHVPDKKVDLLRPGAKYPTFDDLMSLPLPTLSIARQNGLHKVIYSVSKRKI